MNEWYEKYVNKTFLDKSKIEKYISILQQSNLKTDDNIEVKVSQIENDYEIKLKELEEICVNEEETDKYISMNSLVILQKELEIIKLLSKYALQNNQLNYIFFVSSLKFLYKLSEILRIRLGQKEIIHEKKLITNNNIPRCSYKFCNYKYECTYNYNTKLKSQCYQDHYVHRMVSADLFVLINYISQKFNDQSIVIHNKEILKTINTLSFVINHMESELRLRCMYLDESQWEKNHFVKNV
jgi:hypothetical protein